MVDVVGTELFPTLMVTAHPVQVDYTILGTPGDSVFLVASSTDDLREHLAGHVEPDAQWLGGNLAVEHRYIEGFIRNLIEEGFTVEWDGEVF